MYVSNVLQFDFSFLLICTSFFKFKMFFTEYSLLHFIFDLLITSLVVNVIAVTFLEKYVSDSFLQFYKYGKLKSNRLPKPSIEVPKSWFKHFYIFASCWSVCVFLIILRVYFYNEPVPVWFSRMLDILCSGQRITQCKFKYVFDNKIQVSCDRFFNLMYFSINYLFIISTNWINFNVQIVFDTYNIKKIKWNAFTYFLNTPLTLKKGNHKNYR